MAMRYGLIVRSSLLLVVMTQTITFANTVEDESSSALPIVLPQTDEPSESESLTTDEPQSTEEPLSTVGTIKEKAARGRLEKKIESYFRKSKLTKRRGRKNIDDYYVVAKFHLPLESRAAELRFDVMEGLEKSSKAMIEYLTEKPPRTLRQFKIVYRFKTSEEAKRGVDHARKQYDKLKDYQARLLAYVKQADSMRRC